MIEPNHISFRDNVARVVLKGDTYYRYIFFEYEKEYNHLMQSGLYSELTQKKLLIEHQEIEINTDDPKVYRLLLPYQIPFHGYPFEWSFSQWKKTIQSYLKINLIALKYGMILKDATPYNFYIEGGKAIMLDTSSFIFFNNNDPWLAYKQFCEEILGPFALMYYKGAEWSSLINTRSKSLSLKFISNQLPINSWLNITVLLHIHFHSKYTIQHIQQNKIVSQIKLFDIEKIESLHKMIYDEISCWNIKNHISSHWNSYYESNIEHANYIKDKEKVIRKWLKIANSKTILDIGANTGMFSFIASEYGERIIALENDYKCVDKIDNHITTNELNKIFTIVGDVTELTPARGLQNLETLSFLERGKSEIVLSLALMHHLHIVNHMSFAQISNFFYNFSSKYVITEFININDSKVQLLLENKKIDIANYNEKEFLFHFNKSFSLLEYVKIKGTERVLYFFKKLPQ